jgi:hypothetical protein
METVRERQLPASWAQTAFLRTSRSEVRVLSGAELKAMDERRLAGLPVVFYWATVVAPGAPRGPSASKEKQSWEKLAGLKDGRSGPVRMECWPLLWIVCQRTVGSPRHSGG